MSQPRKAAGASEEDDPRSALATLRDALARSVMLPSDRIRETLEDAVERGRITRDDAEDLLERLVILGRQQTEETLSRIERLLPGPPATAKSSDRPRVAVRRPPGTDRLLREVDRVRRSAGLGSTFPIAGYDDLTAAQVVARLAELSDPDLRRVREHERRNANRKSVLAAVEKRLR